MRILLDMRIFNNNRCRNREQKILLWEISTILLTGFYIFPHPDQIFPALSFIPELPASFFQNPVSLKAGEVKEFSTQTGKATEDQNCALFLALGNSGSGYELWIDEIEFTAMEQAADGGDAIIKQLSDFPDKESLRDCILKERGWKVGFDCF